MEQELFSRIEDAILKCEDEDEAKVLTRILMLLSFAAQDQVKVVQFLKHEQPSIAMSYSTIVDGFIEKASGFLPKPKEDVIQLRRTFHKSKLKGRPSPDEQAEQWIGKHRSSGYIFSKSLRYHDDDSVTVVLLYKEARKSRCPT